MRNNTVIGNKRGVWLTGNTQETLVERQRLHGHAGRRASGSSARTTTACEANEIDGSSGAGVALEGSTHNTIVDNEMEANNGGVVLDVTHTPPVDVQSNDNRVERNVIDESGGLEIIESDRNELVDNVVRRSNESGRVTRVRARQRRPRQRPAHEQERHLPQELDRQRARGQRRQRLRQHRHLARVAVVLQRPDPQRVQQQRRRRHLRRRRGARRHRDADRGQPRRTTTRATASTSPSRAT